MIKKIINFPWHPFSFGIFPILFLLNTNALDLDPLWIVRPFISSLLISGLLLIILKFLAKEWPKAAILASLLILLFFTYGHIYKLIKGLTFFGMTVEWHRILLVLWLVILIVLFGLLLWKIRVSNLITKTLNYISLVLVLINGVPLLTTYIQTLYNKAISTGIESQIKTNSVLSISEKLSPPDQSALPDIYYIILDDYPRADILKDQNGFDNSSFLAQLKNMGFYIVPCAQSNYGITVLSIGTSLNMDYIDNIARNEISQNARWKDLGVYLRYSVVRQTLKSLGYMLIAFDTGQGWANITDADIYYQSPKNQSSIGLLFGAINPFERLLVDTTALLPVIESTNLLPADIFATGGEDAVSMEHTAYLRNIYNLQKLDETLFVQGPKFVYAHLMTTHTPFVFNTDGSYRQKDYYFPSKQGFLDSITYTNIRVLNLVQEIQKKSKIPPIIIIQADHGLRVNGLRVFIFNAIYFPGNGKNDLYPTITPVNTFRVLFNKYFQANLDLLEDHSYESGIDDPYNYTTIPVPQVCNQ